MKCPPAPPIADDSQFFTVVNPYPDQPHQSIEDSKAFARWIACIVAEENLLAFYHKPKSANAVLIEVMKDTADLRRLLGAHRWASILNAPDEQDQDQLGEEESSIFQCTLTTERAVRNAGWRRCDVKSSWFTKWSPAAPDGAIVYPYPIPHYCRPPAEDPTGERLCRPLRMLLSHQPAASDDSTQRTIAQNNRPPLASTPSISPRSPHLYRSTYTYTYTHAQTPTVASESSDVSTDADADEFSTPPCNGPKPARTQFVPAIHGSDAPKSDAILPVPVPPSPSSASLWADVETEETETDTREGGALCAAHGVLCSSGICKLCGQLKREAERERRRREREEERGAQWTKPKRKHSSSRAHGERDKPRLGLESGHLQGAAVRGRETSGQQQRQRPSVPVRPPPAHLLKSTLPRAATPPELAHEEGNKVTSATKGKPSDTPRLTNTTNVTQTSAERTREEGYDKTEDRRARLRPDITVISTKGKSHSHGPSLRANMNKDANSWFECVEPFKVCDIDFGDCEDAVSITSEYTDEPF